MDKFIIILTVNLLLTVLIFIHSYDNFYIILIVINIILIGYQLYFNYKTNENSNRLR